MSEKNFEVWFEEIRNQLKELQQLAKTQPDWLVKNGINVLNEDFKSLLQSLNSLKIQHKNELDILVASISQLHGSLVNLKLEDDKRIESLLADLQNMENEAKAMVATLNEDRKKLQAENQELKALVNDAPLSYGTFIRKNEDDTVDIEIPPSNARVKAQISKDEIKKLKHVGQRVLLTPPSQFSRGGNVLQVLDEYEERGDEVTVDEIMGDNLIRVRTMQDEKELVLLGGDLTIKDIGIGDKVLCRAGIVLRILPKKETSELLLEEIPNISYDQIGGQDEAKRRLRELIEYPFVYANLFGKYMLRPPRGLLLFGPPGCGKTMSLKAVANSLQQALGKKVMLLTVLGPQLLTMWVGETERKLREPFEIAKAKAKEGVFVIILFDELDAMFPTRGTHAGSGGVHETSVTQFSTMLDGIEEASNVIVIGTTNRPDLIDPALTRPGRLYPLIEFPRPDEEGVKKIFSIYLNPLAHLTHNKYVDESHAGWREKYNIFKGDRSRVINDYFIEDAVDLIFSKQKDSLQSRLKSMEKQKVVTIKYMDGAQEFKTFYMKDLISGAIIKNAVERTQLRAILSEIKKEEGGLRVSYLLDSIEEVFKEGEALPNRTDPSEWARILGVPISRHFRIVEADEKREEKPSKTESRTTA